MNIKVRVWDEKYKEWQKSPILIYPGEPVNTQGRVIQMFTGLLDKNGKEIYEGDIISESYDEVRGYIYGKTSLNTKLENPIVYKSVVIWCDQYHCFLVNRTLNGEKDNARMFPLNNYNVELLGNVFDNPDLAESILKA